MPTPPEVCNFGHGQVDNAKRPGKNRSVLNFSKIWHWKNKRAKKITWKSSFMILGGWWGAKMCAVFLNKTSKKQFGNSFVFSFEPALKKKIASTCEPGSEKACVLDQHKREAGEVQSFTIVGFCQWVKERRTGGINPWSVFHQYSTQNEGSREKMWEIVSREMSNGENMCARLWTRPLLAEWKTLNIYDGVSGLALFSTPPPPPPKPHLHPYLWHISYGRKLVEDMKVFIPLFTFFWPQKCPDFCAWS